MTGRPASLIPTGQEKLSRPHYFRRAAGCTAANPRRRTSQSPVKPWETLAGARPWPDIRHRGASTRPSPAPADVHRRPAVRPPQPLAATHRPMPAHGIRHTSAPENPGVLGVWIRHVGVEPLVSLARCLSLSRTGCRRASRLLMTDTLSGRRQPLGFRCRVTADVDPPAGQAGGKPGVLSFLADGEGQLVVRDDDARGLGPLVDDPYGNNLRRRQSIPDEARRVL